MTLHQGNLWILAICMVAVRASPPPTGQIRDKREMAFSSPIYYDQVVAPQPQFPQLQPQQGLPIIGALIPGFLANGANGLSTLIPFGNMGQFLNLGGLIPGAGLPQTQQQQCPLGQISRCRCESLLPISPKHQDTLEILQQKVSLNISGQKEISARLSNDLLLYQRSGRENVPPTNQESNVTQGYYTLKIRAGKYLTIYYTITEGDYTVKADVTTEPPKNDLDETPPPPSQLLEF